MLITPQDLYVFTAKITFYSVATPLYTTCLSFIDTSLAVVLSASHLVYVIGRISTQWHPEVVSSAFISTAPLEIKEKSTGTRPLNTPVLL